MTTQSRRYRELSGKAPKNLMTDLEEAIAEVLKLATADFVETIECHVNLNIDPRKADQQLRSSIVLPAGTGQEVSVIVFARGEKQREAEEAGADRVGAEDLIEEVENGWLDFDAAIATPDIMADVGKLGPQLGPRGLMPNNKAGTVTFDVAETVEKIKGGQIEIRNDSYGIIHTPVGTDEMTPAELLENLKTVLRFVVADRPSVVGRGQYIKSITLVASMSPAVGVEPAVAWELD